MHKIVNGKKIDLTATEIAKRQIEENEWLAKKPARDAENAKARREADLMRPDAIAAIVGWIEANPGTMTQAMRAVINQSKAKR